jgi:hypothetical protein
LNIPTGFISHHYAQADCQKRFSKKVKEKQLLQNRNCAKKNQKIPQMKKAWLQPDSRKTGYPAPLPKNTPTNQKKKPVNTTVADAYRRAEK